MQIISFIEKIVRRSISTKYGWHGDYERWEDAVSQCSGYDKSNIIDKVKDATLKVKNGEAAYERDSVLFNQVEYSWPLLSALMWVAALNEKKISVLDFGGALGSSYFQNKKFLDTMDIVQWNVVEQKSFVECGQKLIKNEQLNFFHSIDEAIKEKAFPDVLLIACTLPYVQHPYLLLQELMKYRIPYLILDNTPFNYTSGDRLTIQRVHPSIYEASYPCWLLHYEKVISIVELSYTVITEHFNDSRIYVDGRKIQYRGFLGKNNTV